MNFYRTLSGAEACDVVIVEISSYCTLRLRSAYEGYQYKCFIGEEIRSLLTVRFGSAQRTAEGYQEKCFSFILSEVNDVSSYGTLRLRSAYSRRLPIQIFLIYFIGEEIFYFKIMKGYKIVR
ncbi:hypothetical protein QWT87_14150 [Chryseobacterium sp. APV1]|uniref:Uncharacterized protein n=1 Tax=Chryseobacterium urinae TaxID=3058400 RepID=A0ABT8U997_9FLAO|nr:hypothetical protein [Chryseobacterium sp. APV1]MDO3426039.1 hypothetical protein [Chryseobacterium sp. APV1]